MFQTKLHILSNNTYTVLFGRCCSCQLTSNRQMFRGIIEGKFSLLDWQSISNPISSPPLPHVIISIIIHIRMHSRDCSPKTHVEIRELYSLCFCKSTGKRNFTFVCDIMYKMCHSMLVRIGIIVLALAMKCTSVWYFFPQATTLPPITTVKVHDTVY